MEENKISRAVIKRLPRYYRYLSELLDQGIMRISSQELSTRMSITASQVRKDFNNFGGFGQQGYGYDVSYLHDEIAKILGLDQHFSVAIIGCGNLGRALANYPGFAKRGFRITAIFDVNKEIVGSKVGNIIVNSMEDLEEYVREKKVDIAAITIPKDQASKVANTLLSYGVKAFWNFASVDLHLPSYAAVENVHLAESLMRLSYKLAKKEDGGDIDEER